MQCKNTICYYNLDDQNSENCFTCLQSFLKIEGLLVEENHSETVFCSAGPTSDIWKSTVTNSVTL